MLNKCTSNKNSLLYCCEERLNIPKFKWLSYYFRSVRLQDWAWVPLRISLRYVQNCNTKLKASFSNFPELFWKIYIQHQSHNKHTSQCKIYARVLRRVPDIISTSDLSQGSDVSNCFYLFPAEKTMIIWSIFAWIFLLINVLFIFNLKMIRLKLLLFTIKWKIKGVVVLFEFPRALSLCWIDQLYSRILLCIVLLPSWWIYQF